MQVMKRSLQSYRNDTRSEAEIDRGAFEDCEDAKKSHRMVSKRHVQEVPSKIILGDVAVASKNSIRSRGSFSSMS